MDIPTKSILKVATQEESLSFQGIRRDRFDEEEKRSDDEQERHNRVRFAKLERRMYNVIPETNPSVSSGPAIGLDWSYVELPIVSVDAFEANRLPRLKIADVQMTYIERITILKEAGVPPKELYEAIFRTDVARNKREETIQNLKYEELEMRRESLIRNIKKKLHIQRSDAAAQKMLWKKAQAM